MRQAQGALFLSAQSIIFPEPSKAPCPLEKLTFHNTWVYGTVTMAPPSSHQGAGGEPASSLESES